MKQLGVLCRQKVVFEKPKNWRYNPEPDRHIQKNNGQQAIVSHPIWSSKEWEVFNDYSLRSDGTQLRENEGHWRKQPSQPKFFLSQQNRKQNDDIYIANYLPSVVEYCIVKCLSFDYSQSGVLFFRAIESVKRIANQ